MRNAAFIFGFTSELEKSGVAFLAPLAAMAGKALLTEAATSIVGKVKKNVGQALEGPKGGRQGAPMSQGTKGGQVPTLTNKSTTPRSNLGGFADIIRARMQKQPSNAGNSITTPR
jgi:hypothetical protein